MVIWEPLTENITMIDNRYNCARAIIIVLFLLFVALLVSWVDYLFDGH